MNPTAKIYIAGHRSLGSGIPRPIEAWPQLELIDARRGNQLRVTIRRGLAQLAEALDTPLRTMARWPKQLRKAGRIEFVGSSKTGGYHAKAAP